eukprot:TRINITY_DN3234_c0_g1_i5.p1 TRINITY_DN3234_c0_g1~~TRINITY_DN3234_c0_g1_i5.p1  ORF type:complete len:281 (-),score=39.40 TRINITY_DN3234_c0_g1_i5:136-978(-)
MKENREQMLKDRKQFEEMRERVEKLALTNNDSIVSLNIGGTVFSSSRKTFSLPNTYFSTLLAELSQDTFFIDRDPRLFPFVMSYLRNGEWPIGRLSVDELDRLDNEIKFYGLRMARKCYTLDENKCNMLTLTNNNTTCTGSGTVLCLHPLPRIATWEITIDQKTGNNWSAFGIATPRADLSSLCTDTQGCGIYIDQNNCYFRQRSDNVEQLNSIIGSATAGKVIRVYYKREETTTLQFETGGVQTQPYVVKLPDRVAFVALSPSTDCVMSIRNLGEEEEW